MFCPLSQDGFKLALHGFGKLREAQISQMIIVNRALDAYSQFVGGHIMQVGVSLPQLIVNFAADPVFLAQRGIDLPVEAVGRKHWAFDEQNGRCRMATNAASFSSRS